MLKYAMMPVIKRLTLIINKHKLVDLTLIKPLEQAARTLGVSINLIQEYPLPKNFLDDTDACCIVGGDGTLLNGVTEAAIKAIPLFGMNQGSLGFLATFSPNETIDYWIALLSGNYQIDQRSLLCYSDTHDKPIGFALNDIVIKNRSLMKLVQLEVYFHDQFVTRYTCDGLIFATPTGSTAYNLSAGGPIAYPQSSIILMTPICPHTLTNRSVIFPSDAVIFVHAQLNENTPQITLDGHTHFQTHTHFPARISIAHKKLMLLQPINYGHFHVLRNKLNWR